ncbi:MAG TPA: Gfo/Idh/MocA family oxidoreductase [Acidimicrobiia bacterium]|jgi:predicted dehydrogenase
MSSSLGAVVVGTGFGVITHARALAAAGIEVRALVGRDPDKTATRAALYDIPFATTDRAEAFARDDVDVVAVTTPPHTHAEIVLDAVAAGKHVLCEKPFARDVDQAREMLRAAEAAGVVHLLGTEFRFAPGQALLTRTVRSGAIGEPRFFLFVLQLPTLHDPAAVMPAWWDDADQGGGWLGAHGTHVIDQVRTTMGEITRASAALETLSPRPMTADDTYSVQFETADGATGLLHSSCATGGQFVVALKVTGTNGSAWTQGDEVWIDTGAGPTQVPPADDLPAVAPVPPPSELLHTTYDMWHSMGIDLAPYTRLYEVMRDRILGSAVPDDPSAGTFADGVANQAVVDAIRSSSASRDWTEVSR